MNDTVRKRLEDIEARVKRSLCEPTPEMSEQDQAELLSKLPMSQWALLSSVEMDLLWLLQLVRYQAVLIGDLQQDSSAYQRGVRDERLRCVGILASEADARHGTPDFSSGERGRLEAEARLLDRVACELATPPAATS